MACVTVPPERQDTFLLTGGCRSLNIAGGWCLGAGWAGDRENELRWEHERHSGGLNDGTRTSPSTDFFEYTWSQAPLYRITSRARRLTKAWGEVLLQTPSAGLTPQAPQPGSARASLMAQYPSLSGLGGSAPPTFSTPAPAAAPPAPAAPQLTSGPGTATPPMSESGGHQTEEERLRAQVAATTSSHLIARACKP
jgi:hypothetical protein